MKIKNSLYPLGDKFNELKNLHYDRQCLERQLDSCRWENIDLVTRWETVNDTIEDIERRYGIEYE
jgi:hypothetical protein